MTGRDLCEQCDGFCYVHELNYYGEKKVCDLCGGDGVKHEGR